MHKDLICISGIIALAAVLLLSLLPAAIAQEDNSTMLNNTTSENITLNDTTLNDNTALSVNSAFQIGKGLDENVIDVSRLSKDNATFQINYGNAKETLEMGLPAKPVRDLEKIVFICNIV